MEVANASNVLQVLTLKFLDFFQVAINAQQELLIQILVCNLAVHVYLAKTELIQTQVLVHAHLVEQGNIQILELHLAPTALVELILIMDQLFVIFAQEEAFHQQELLFAISVH